MDKIDSMNFKFLYFFLLIFSVCLNAQENISALTVPAPLKENANAVIRLSEKTITITSRKSMNIKRKRIVTVYNEYGLSSLDASEIFSKSTSVKSVEAVVYDSFGKEIKKIKRKDFKQSSFSQGSFITDDHLLSYDYTPVTYPFTFVYESEVQTSNTAFIPSWSPLEGLHVSVEKAVFNVQYQPELGFRYKEYNFEGYSKDKNETAGALTYTMQDIPAVKREDYLPSLHKIAPHVLFALDRFNLEGVDGEVSDWKTFGTWMYSKLLEGTDELPEATIAAIREKVGNENDVLKKARIVYEYVQSKTRYVSIQLGIGGWKPMKAKDVDRLGYGDCKALTNYTRALLGAVGVKSFYTVIYGGNVRKDMKADFASIQGNHVILAVPYNNNYIWLECTSQVAPFGFQGNFTDDRIAIVIKPEGGEAVKTSAYTTEDNMQASKGSYTITEGGDFVGAFTRTSKGVQYDDKYYLESRSAEDLDKFYKNAFSQFNNLKLKKKALANNKNSQEFTEELSMEAESYCNKSGNRLIFPVNAFNQSGVMPQRYRERRNPFEIQHGFIDTDELVVNLPDGFAIEAKPDDINLKDKFGEYTAEYQLLDGNKILYKRTLKIKSGFYESGDYENYRLFREKIARNDNAKIVLVKN